MAMPVGIYRVQSPGFPKIAYCKGQSHKTVSTEHVDTPKQRYNTEVRSDIHLANRSFNLEERKKVSSHKRMAGTAGWVVGWMAGSVGWRAWTIEWMAGTIEWMAGTVG